MLTRALRLEGLGAKHQDPSVQRNGELGCLLSGKGLEVVWPPWWAELAQDYSCLCTWVLISLQCALCLIRQKHGFFPLHKGFRSPSIARDLGPRSGSLESPQGRVGGWESRPVHAAFPQADRRLGSELGSVSSSSLAAEKSTGLCSVHLSAGWGTQSVLNECLVNRGVNEAVRGQD